MNLRTLLAATITSGVLLSSAHSALATCPFSQLKGTGNTSDGTPMLLSPHQFDFNKLGIVGASAAAIALAGLAVRRAGKAAASESDDFTVSTFPIPVPPEALTSASQETAKNELERIG